MGIEIHNVLKIDTVNQTKKISRSASERDSVST